MLLGQRGVVWGCHVNIYAVETLDYTFIHTLRPLPKHVTYESKNMNSDHRDYDKNVVEGLVAQLLTGNKYKLKSKWYLKK